MNSIEDVKEFKKALRKIIKECKPNDQMTGCGLCASVKMETRRFDSSYMVMAAFLMPEEFNNGLGPNFVMTTDRWHFAKFMLMLTDKEIFELCI